MIGSVDDNARQATRKRLPAMLQRDAAPHHAASVWSVYDTHGSRASPPPPRRATCTSPNWKAPGSPDRATLRLPHGTGPDARVAPWTWPGNRTIAGVCFGRTERVERGRLTLGLDGDLARPPRRRS